MVADRLNLARAEQIYYLVASSHRHAYQRIECSDWILVERYIAPMPELVLCRFRAPMLARIEQIAASRFYSCVSIYRVHIHTHTTHT